MYQRMFRCETIRTDFKDANDLISYPHYMNQRPAALHALEHNFAQTSQQQHVHLVFSRFVAPPPKSLVLFTPIGSLEQLCLAGFAKGREERAERSEIQLERRILEEPVDLLRQHTNNLGGVVRR